MKIKLFLHSIFALLLSLSLVQSVSAQDYTEADVGDTTLEQLIAEDPDAFLSMLVELGLIAPPTSGNGAAWECEYKKCCETYGGDYRQDANTGRGNCYNGNRQVSTCLMVGQFYAECNAGSKDGSLEAQLGIPIP